MAIVQGICNSYKRELLVGNIHIPAAQTWRLALYTAAANLSPQYTTAYTSAGEASGIGYSAGGKAISPKPTPVLAGDTAYLSFPNVIWTNVTISVRGALLFNGSGNRAIAVIDFGSTITLTNKTLTVQMPGNTAGTALIRIT